MKGPIHPVPRERFEGRSSAKVPTAWVGGDPVARNRNGGSWLTSQVNASLANNATPILVMLGADAAANEHLKRWVANSARAYVLVGPGGDLEAPSKNALVRRVPEVPVSALHSASECRVWIGGGLSLKLDGKQADALRQTFLRLFWHDATDEAWLDGRKLVWRPVRSRPFDIPELIESSAIRWEAPDARISIDLRGARVHLSGGEPPTASPRRLWFRAGAAHHDRLTQLVKNGTEVLWDDIGLPDLVVTDSIGEALLPGKLGRLRIRLMQAQAREVASLLDGPASWTFRSDVCIGDPMVRRASLWLSGEREARTIMEKQTFDLPAVSAASLRDVEATKPNTWPAPQPLALSVLYRWSVTAPRIPAGSEEDQLLKRWRTLDDHWTKRLSAVREAVEKADGERNRIGKAFSQLLGGVLGFERKHKDLLEQVTTLEAERPSRSGPSEAAALFLRLDTLEESARQHQGDLEQAERKARDDENREKQMDEWSKQVERAKKDAEAAREELSKVEARDAELDAETKDIESRLKDAQADAKKDLEVQQKRNGDERKKNTDRLRRLRHDVSSHDKAAARPFVFDAAKLEAKGQMPQGKRFIPPAPAQRSAISVPEDALPEVGSLRIHKGQRYLIIDAWEQLDAGERAALRLSAKLVAPENA